MERLFSSKEDRDQFVNNILKEGRCDWLYEELKKHDNPHGNQLAWALSAVCDRENQWFEKHRDDIVVWLPNVKTQGIKRSVLRSVVPLPLSVEKEGEWVDYLFELTQNTETDIAVKVHAIEILSKYVIRYPELANELYLILEDNLPYYGPALKSRSKKVMKKLTKVLY
ncbi:hypothetical protein [Flammeovirga sp. SJP92]|uniref:hypothetical protein n=1 Tax=Flammeovirga sp. SJP92 TaxID=1775430 RepID=UPI00078693AA|nr:hypothetical protein [Flammeovirga sp. SJP92]KXX70512.1 hypothetical protein AVL50_08425 [Flammeovirga sp. SJP92]